MPTALLICLENTFWNISRDDNFVELFKKSFALYVKSGTREKIEVDIDILKNEQGRYLVTKDFKGKFYKIIIEHYLRKCTHLCSTHLTAFFAWIQPTLEIKLMSWNKAMEQSLLGWKGWCYKYTKDDGAENLLIERQNIMDFMTVMLNKLQKL